MRTFDGAHIRTLLLTLLYRQMPELIERGYVHIAQPPLYKIKHGKSEMYIKDEHALDQHMLTLALDGASLTPKEGAGTIEGNALGELARGYLLSEAVIRRLTDFIEPEVLRAALANTLISMSVAKQPRKPAQHALAQSYQKTSTSAPASTPRTNVGNSLSKKCVTATCAPAALMKTSPRWRLAPDSQHLGTHRWFGWRRCSRSPWRKVIQGHKLCRRHHLAPGRS